jgi:hypothetical protein
VSKCLPVCPRKRTSNPALMSTRAHAPITRSRLDTGRPACGGNWPAKAPPAPQRSARPHPIRRDWTGHAAACPPSIRGAAACCCRSDRTAHTRRPAASRKNLLIENGCNRRILPVRPRGLGLLLPLRRGGPVARVRRESHAADARRSLQEPRGPCFQRFAPLLSGSPSSH